MTKCAACAKLLFWLLNLLIFNILVAVTVPYSYKTNRTTNTKTKHVCGKGIT